MCGDWFGKTDLNPQSKYSTVSHLNIYIFHLGQKWKPNSRSHSRLPLHRTFVMTTLCLRNHSCGSDSAIIFYCWLVGLLVCWLVGWLCGLLIRMLIDLVCWMAEYQSCYQQNVDWFLVCWMVVYESLWVFSKMLTGWLVCWMVDYESLWVVSKMSNDLMLLGISFGKRLIPVA